MAATAAAPRGTTAAAATTTTSRFAAACGALSQYVRASEVMARATPPASALPVRQPLPLMPGAEVPDCNEEPEAPAPAPAAAQLTIVYGGRVLILDDVPSDKAAELLRLAAAAAVAQGSGTDQSGATCGGGGLISAADLPVARKASLQRFMHKRKGRRDEPYRRPAPGGGRDDLALAL